MTESTTVLYPNQVGEVTPASGPNSASLLHLSRLSYQGVAATDTTTADPL